MSTLDDATRTQIANIERRTGRSMDELVAMVAASGLQKHGEIVAWLKTEHGFGHGDANLVALDLEARAADRRRPGRRRRCHLRRPEGRAPTVPRSGHRARPRVRRRRRTGAEAGVRGAAAQEAIRDRRAGVRWAPGGRAQSQRRAGRRAFGGHDRDVHAPGPTDVAGRARRRGHGLAAGGLRPGVRR